MGGMYNNEQSSMPADLSEICDMSPVTVISDMRSPVNLSDLTERELFEINLTRWLPNHISCTWKPSLCYELYQFLFQFKAWCNLSCTLQNSCLFGFIFNTSAYTEISIAGDISGSHAGEYEV
jgi:hypothetical protein